MHSLAFLTLLEFPSLRSLVLGLSLTKTSMSSCRGRQFESNQARHHIPRIQRQSPKEIVIRPPFLLLSRFQRGNCCALDMSHLLETRSLVYCETYKRYMKKTGTRLQYDQKYYIKRIKGRRSNDIIILTSSSLSRAESKVMHSCHLIRWRPPLPLRHNSFARDQLKKIGKDEVMQLTYL